MVCRDGNNTVFTVWNCQKEKGRTVWHLPLRPAFPVLCAGYLMTVIFVTIPLLPDASAAKTR